MAISKEKENNDKACDFMFEDVAGPSPPKNTRNITSDNKEQSEMAVNQGSVSY